MSEFKEIAEAYTQMKKGVINESFAGKAVVSYSDKTVTNISGTLVYKTEGGAPNIQANLSMEGGRVLVSYDISKGFLKQKQNAKEFMAALQKITSNIDTLEYTIYSPKDEKAIEKALKTAGFKNISFK